MRYFQVPLIALAAVALSSVGLAQTASIAGTVTDSSGAVVQGAEVTVRNLATSESRSTKSSESGAYTITNLAVGDYEVTSKQSAFRTFRVSRVTLTVAQSATMNIQLQPGGASEEVTVRGDQLPDVELQDAQISNLVDQTQMESLPLITRNPYQLVLLSPGTSQTDSSNGGFSVNGARDRNNNFLLDGVDNNDTSVPGGQGGVLNANPDSTQEFRVITDNFNAEYGRNTGAIIDVVTKSGTNSLHGGAYYFGRWNGFGGARDWFNPGTGPNAGPMNPYIRHQFGFSVGGPIIKNKTFFFFNDEMDRFRTTLTNNATVPTAAFLTGKFNYTFSDTNGVQQTVPIDLTSTGANNAFGIGLDPTVLAVLSKYPTASQSANGISGTVFFPSTSATSTYNPTIKLDHHFNDRESLSLRYAYNHFFDPNNFHSDFLPGNIGAIGSKDINEGLSAQLTSTLSNTLVNNFQFGWNHIYATFFLAKKTTSLLDAPGGVDSFGNGWDYTLDPFTSFASPLGGSDSQNRKTGTVSYTDNITWIHGNHALKFGFDFRNVRESGFDNFSSRRQLSLSPLLSFGFDPGLVANEPTNDPSTTLVDAANALYGFVIQDVQSQFFNKTGVRQPTDNKTFRQHEYDWFGQDTWKVRRNVTLNLGLRYQLNGVPYEEGANFSNLLQDPGSLAPGASAVFAIVGPGTGHSLYNPDYKDIEPRIGLTWDPWSDGKTAVRAGFGIFHDRVFGNEFGNARANPPFQAQYSQFELTTISNSLTFGIPFPSQISTQTTSASIPDGSALSEVVFDTHFRNPASNNWNLDIQRELGGNNVVDIAYVGAMGVHVLGQRDGNPPDPALVQQLVTYCSDPANAVGCTAATVSGISLYIGATPTQGINDLPFNAVNNNALLQPFYQITAFNSIYHGLQTKFTHRMSHGLQVQGAYTWSHALDNSVDPLTPAVGARTFPRNSRNLAESYGNSDNDTRHVAVMNYIWEMPFGHGKGYLNQGAVGRLLEGMELTGILTLQSGHPFNIRGTKDTQRTGVNAWGYQVGNPFGPPTGSGCSPAPGSGFVYFTNQCAFVNPPLGSASNNERNNFYGPGFWDWDMSFSKKMRLTERVNAELRFEGYNVFNRPHFLNPGTDAAGLGNLINNGQFGVISNTFTQPDGTTSARQLQVALRIKF
jgi:Carboxypeptidase regulatory-like domain/TonB-dependent Receptor Plug Domain